MRVLATVLHRVTDAKFRHGALLEIDWERKEVLRLIEAPPLYAELGQRERGGRRGLRGITCFDSLIWVASFDALWGLDPTTLALERVVTHPWLSDVHEIECGKGGIWVASTGADGIVLMDTDQQALSAAWLCGEPNVDRRVVLEKDQFHVNSVFERDDRVYAYAHQTGQVFQMLPTPVTQVGVLEKYCHNVTMTELGWFRNESPQSLLRVGDKALKMPQLSVKADFALPKWLRAGWLRGMARCPNGNFLVGSSPASLFEVDAVSMRVVDQFSLTDDVYWTIHGLFIDSEGSIDRPDAASVRDAQQRLEDMFSSTVLRKMDMRAVRAFKKLGTFARDQVRPARSNASSRRPRI